MEEDKLLRHTLRKAADQTYIMNRSRTLTCPKEGPLGMMVTL